MLIILIQGVDVYYEGTTVLSYYYFSVQSIAPEPDLSGSASRQSLVERWELNIYIKGSYGPQVP